MFSSRKNDDFLLDSGLTLEEIQKERQEYVKNIGIEYRFGCFEEKKADSCQLLGEYFQSIEQNFTEAFKIFRDNCEKNQWPRSCFKYAQYLMAGKSCDPSFEKAMEPLRVACDGNVSKACKHLALIHWNAGPNREPDSEKAEHLMRQACDMENFDACWILSTWYMGPMAKFATQRGKAIPLDHRTGSLSRDMDKALEYGKRACEKGNLPQSCMNVSRMYRIGDGVPKDPDRAKYYHQRMNELKAMLAQGWDPSFTG